VGRIDPDALAREVVFTAARSGGPGGQNVNKVSSKAILSFDVAASRALDGTQRETVARELAARISKRGILRIACQTQRSFDVNRERAWERFLALLEEALRHRKARRKTKPTAGSRERRIGEKKQRSAVKRERASGRKERRDPEG
jgi:ribosome-associated protein